MTEMSPVCHITAPGRNRPGSSGRPVAGTECRLVDPESGEDCAPGEAGELWVRGPQVMLGYRNNPAATAATLTADGWLKTGDLAQIDADGYMTIVDRVKELIKVSGFQVAPAEIEALLVAHPEVADVAVVGVADEKCGEVPKAFVVAAAGARADAGRAAGVPRRACGGVQADPGARARRGDPEVAVGEDPAAAAAGATGARGGSGVTRTRRSAAAFPGAHVAARVPQGRGADAAL